MKLSTISDSGQHITLGRILKVWSSVLNEGVGPWWPQEWADSCFHNQQFVQWLEDLGVQGAVGPPMMGGVGRAYPVGDSFIVKFTTNTKEASAAKVMHGHSSQHAAQIYDVRRVGVFNSKDGRKPLYAIVMQRLNTNVGKKMRVAGQGVYTYLDKHPSIDDKEEAIDTIINNYIPKAYKNDRDIPGLVSKLINALLDIKRERGVLNRDPHGGNLSFRGRSPAFFDFGRSDIDYDNEHASSSIASL